MLLRKLSSAFHLHRSTKESIIYWRIDMCLFNLKGFVYYVLKVFVTHSSTNVQALPWWNSETKWRAVRLVFVLRNMEYYWVQIEKNFILLQEQ